VKNKNSLKDIRGFLEEIHGFSVSLRANPFPSVRYLERIATCISRGSNVLSELRELFELEV